MASKSEKTISSRLMTMKFMQRAAASSPSSNPSTPSGPPNKRQRLSNGTAAISSPATPTDQDRIQAALAEEEQKRVKAIERQGAEAGETRWVLSIVEDRNRKNPGLHVVSAGYSEIDAANDIHGDTSDEEEEQTALVGRKSFGKFKDPDTVATKQNGSESLSSDSGSDEEDEEEEEEEEDDDPLAEMLREERKAASSRAREDRREKKKATQAEMERLAQDRRKKNINLNEVRSISGRGSTTGTGQITCYACGDKGHTAKQCPQKDGGVSRNNRR